MKHIAAQKGQSNHQIVSYNWKLSEGDKIENMKCADHSLNFVKYCVTCSKALCEDCVLGVKDSTATNAAKEDHTGHEIVALQDIVKDAAESKPDLIKKLREQITKAKSSAQFFGGMLEILVD